MKILIVLFLFSSILFAQQSQIIRQQNVLFIQKIIESEEKIARNFEKYLLENFTIPTMAELKVNEYLGENFSLDNRFGSDLAFKNSLNLQLTYAITSEKDANDYKNLLYNRDLYRENTVVYLEKNSSNEINYTNSYTEILLQSNEAKTILEILKSGNSIESSCTDTLINKYCNQNQSAIRWYNSSSQWIEYNKEGFDKASVTISTTSLLLDSRLSVLPIGTYIYLNNGSQYVKLKDSILKVD